MLPAYLMADSPVIHVSTWTLIPLAAAAAGNAAVDVWGTGRVASAPIAGDFHAAGDLFSGFAGSARILNRDHIVVGELFGTQRGANDQAAVNDAWISRRHNASDADLREPAGERLSRYTRGREIPARQWLPLSALLRDAMPPLEDFIVAGQPGALGTSSTIAVIIGGLFLLYRGVIDYRIPLLTCLSRVRGAADFADPDADFGRAAVALGGDADAGHRGVGGDHVCELRSDGIAADIHVVFPGDGADAPAHDPARQDGVRDFSWNRVRGVSTLCFGVVWTVPGAADRELADSRTGSLVWRAAAGIGIQRFDERRLKWASKASDGRFVEPAGMGRSARQPRLVRGVFAAWRLGTILSVATISRASITYRLACMRFNPMNMGTGTFMTRFTILIVDDTLSCRESVAAMLRRSGFKVICAENGRRALDVLENHSPDLMLLDLAMPDVSAPEFLQTIRGNLRWRDIPVILFTGSGGCAGCGAEPGRPRMPCEITSHLCRRAGAIERVLHSPLRRRGGVGPRRLLGNQSLKLCSNRRSITTDAGTVNHDLWQWREMTVQQRNGLRSYSNIVRGRPAAEAEAIYGQILNVDPNNLGALQMLARLYYETGRHPQAAQTLQRAIAVDPRNPDFLSNLGSVLAGLGQLDEAAAAVPQALELRPHSAETHGNLANILLARGKPMKRSRSIAGAAGGEAQRTAGDSQQSRKRPAAFKKDDLEGAQSRTTGGRRSCGHSLSRRKSTSLMP